MTHESDGAWGLMWCPQCGYRWDGGSACPKCGREAYVLELYERNSDGREKTT